MTAILYVGHDPINLQLLRSLLHKKFPHITLIEATNGVEAVQQAQLHLPKLVIVDIQLPVMEEYTIPAQLQQHLPHTDMSVWAVSGFAMDQDVVRAFEAGFGRYFTKPLHLFSFVRQLRRELSS
ncbi:response regulator [Paenibacillus sp. WLX2291]|uniref:response regulator n=1 Tax=Paenibacillus sp. WLX2291 TaxID=3296934 RepID=UPI003983FB26